ncbi:homeobox protein BEL1 homolog [Actinidia eriantha]|uniref:homeobox protein BEL1 homolog n=1 Tax=Actinidia eriantha TaxID=165200 RepID=UPI002582A76D|nr:homeobox protein BEL1 homolog [Actinidia eriantha]XP_057463757.1 homeobox protein BEL1 homolog [Actinidia eriantha]XP_057463758.1 homeobox protein BEL1 homolog [Actinidia eriantha]XP_057463759.1 homeobox protein BEL1 homolog [Actinidia eriantha]XP_057463761.1 homeobox protein BEL1 homolog [Actinidia eriantha]
MANQGGEKHMKTNMVSSTGYNCFSHDSISQTHMLNQLQGYEPTPEIYNMATADSSSAALWKGFFSHNKSSDFTTSDHSLAALDHTPTTTAWHVDDSTLRCVFPCEGSERPSQGLSLSLSSTNPPTIGLQSFEFVSSSSRPEGYFGKSVGISQQDQLIQDGFLVRSSKYLSPAQEILSEFCNLGTKQTEPKPKIKPNKSGTNQLWQDHENTGSSSSKKQSVCNLELLDLQRRKSKLLAMLEEVDRRYRHYCDQMKAVVSSFEEVAGHGTAAVYAALASKAMSRHFRCLRDGIVGQIRDTKKALGEKNTTVAAAPGMTHGETPRLRLLDQTLRQQRALQQMSIMESHPWRPQRGLPERSVSVLRAWLFEHFLHPYPSDVDKHILARQTGLSRSQVSNWFINARVRLWKPMVEEMYIEETKEGENMGMASSDDNGRPNPHQARSEDQKPTPDQLVRIDSECLSSIINNHQEKSDAKHMIKNPHNHPPPHNFGRVMDTFGAIDLDFSSYNHHRSSVPYPNENVHQNFGTGTGIGAGGGSGGGSGGVSLTLGLQQHGGSLFYPRDSDMDDCQPIQFSFLDGEGQNLPYRNLMGAQLLHDLAG